ncbi:MAG TPA: lysine--tRNA ligase [Baekduia sp.]|uniref:lysine--tRNA ligase n=1 Tax=Baekduia sp. TaxID=2600305 RepID=UPI002B8AAFF4|nr:lysine--tRNA ligase [Baekduia sp.]HMJ32297.1 lysine--tRNA ligase [Baekduia sp.]
MSDEPRPVPGSEPLGELPDDSASALGESESQLLAVRRAKLDQLRADGIDPFPPSFAGVTPAAEIRAAHEGLEAGEETDHAYRVAGRLTQRRGQGKMAFLDLVDRSGRMQLQARLDVLGPEKMDRLLHQVDLGDIVGIDGTVFVTRRGELSLRIDDYTVLAKALRPPPDAHHGLRDVETRFRRRELDLMANEEARELFTTRARIVSAVRRFLDERGFIEVETPVLQPLYGGAAARPFTTHFNALDRDLFLRIATELYLKRLIVGGLERVYELGKDFRNEGISYKHNPEFTMVEWYEAYADYEDIMRRVEELLPLVAEAAEYDGEIDFAGPYRRVGLIDVIREATGIDVMAHATGAALAGAVEAAGIDMPTEGLEWPALVDDLFSKKVEPTLIQPTFVVDYPKALSPFAKDHRDKPGLVERFEVFANGMEVGNAFTELNDPDEQRARFEAQARLAEAGDEETQPYDEAFVQALEHGMPPTGGIGIGIDRLVLLMTGRHSIREIVLFPAMRD